MSKKLHVSNGNKSLCNTGTRSVRVSCVSAEEFAQLPEQHKCSKCAGKLPVPKKDIKALWNTCKEKTRASWAARKALLSK